MPGTFTVMGMSAGENAGERIFGPLTIQGRAVIGETLIVTLAVGDTAVTVPQEAVAAMILPPPNNEVSIKVRTNLNSSDAGLSISPQAVPFVYPFPEVAPTSLILHTTAGASGLTIAFI